MTISLQSPLDMHLHFRDEEMLQLVAPLSGESFAGGLIMPNLVPPVDHLERLLAYRERITAALKGAEFEPYMALFFRQYSEQELAEAREHILGIKLYPAGATTNSEAGVKAMDAVEPTFKLMEEMGIPLFVHGESDGFVMDREKEFLGMYDYLARKFPKLQITMEHITTADALEMLEQHENLRATVTLQHLVITLDDVAGGMLNPHLFCKPIAKRPEDREALLAAALAAHPKLMLGSDSAPHPVSQKECCGCAAGVFTAPLLLPRLAQLFDKHAALDNLQAFTSQNAQRLYNITPRKKTIVLEKADFVVPESYEGFGQKVVPMHAGETLTWRIHKVL